MRLKDKFYSKKVICFIIFIFFIFYTLSGYLYLRNKFEYRCFVSSAIKSQNILALLDENLTKNAIAFQVVNLRGFIIYVGKNKIKFSTNSLVCEYFKDIDKTKNLINKYTIVPKDVNASKVDTKIFYSQQNFFNKGVLLIKKQCNLFNDKTKM